MYDVVERRYEMKEGEDETCALRLRRTLRGTPSGTPSDNSRWEVKHMTKNRGKRWNMDGVLLSKGLCAETWGDVENTLNAMGFAFVSDSVCRVEEYAIRSFSSTILISEPWKHHDFMRDEWGMSSKPIYTFRNVPSIRNETVRSDSPWTSYALDRDERKRTEDRGAKRKRDEDKNNWVIEIVHPYKKDEKTGKNVVLGRGSHEDVRRAAETAAQEAKSTLLKKEKTPGSSQGNDSNEATNEASKEDQPSPDCVVVSLITTADEIGIGEACERLRSLRARILPSPS